MKLFVYSMREYDEKPCFHRWCKELGLDLGYTADDLSEKNVELARGSDAISVLLNEVDGEKVSRLHALGVKYIATRTVGFDHIDVKTAHALGMKVTHVFYPPEGVANFAILLMLMCCRRMKPILERSLIRNFTLKGDMGLELSNCTVGILGTGQIGSTVARHLSGFGCKLLAYDLHPREELKGLVEYAALDDIYARAHIVTLHMPATPENRHVIGKASLSRMRDGVILINTGRGELVDSAALLEALESGKVGGAGLDVLEREDGLFFEDLSNGPRLTRELALLRAHPNVVVTPHVAFYTDEAVEHMVRNTVKGVLACGGGGDNPFLVRAGS